MVVEKRNALILEYLEAGVSNDRMLQDVIKIHNNQPERINLITRSDLRYLTRK